MKRKKISLSRNREHNGLNAFLSSLKKEEKKTAFKTTQNNSLKIPKLMNRYLRDLNKKEINIIFSVKDYDKIIKKKYNNDYSKLSRFILIDDSDSKLTSPISNTIRYNHSIQRFKHNNYTIRKYRESTSYSGYGHNIIKLNKPYLLKLLDKQLIDKALKLKESSTQSLNPTTCTSTINNLNKYYYLYQQQNLNKYYNYTIYKNENENDKSYSSKKYLLTKNDKISNLKELYTYNNNQYINLIKSFKKLSKKRISFPLEYPNSLSFDKMELRDKIKLDYFNDEKMNRKIRKALYYSLNAFEQDNGNYSEYKNSIQHYINFICDINIIPHIKNKFFYYKKPISRQMALNDFIFNRNAIRKDDAYGLNRHIINNIRKEILEKEERLKREKKLKELSKSNKFMLKLYFEEKEDLPDLTSEEVVELNDYFGKNIDYKSVNIAKDKLKNVVYHDKQNNKK
jgi:hypothetical protein